MAWLNWARKVVVEVMVDGEEVHRSLAPNKMVTYRVPWLAAFSAWVGAAAILAPVTASPMAAMLDGSGGAAQAGWAISPARATTSATTMMRATRPIASPSCSSPVDGLVRPTDRHARPSNRLL